MTTQTVNLAADFAELDVAGVTERLTGGKAWIDDLDELIDALGAPYQRAEDTKQAIWRRLHGCVRAAFVAGVIAGSDPQALLLARLASSADRLERAAERISDANGS